VRYSLLLLGALLTTSGGNSAFAHYCEGDVRYAEHVSEPICLAQQATKPPLS
jgi:hypothetical protein